MVKVRKKEDVQTRTKFKNEQHGRPKKTYHIIIDAKYIKMMVKRSYWTKSLYDFFKSLFQFINGTLHKLESDSKDFDDDFVKKKMGLSSFSFQTIKTYTSSHKNRARDIIEKFDSLYKESNKAPLLMIFLLMWLIQKIITTSSMKKIKRQWDFLNWGYRKYINFRQKKFAND